MQFAPPASDPRGYTARGLRAGDRYLVALGVVLTGYAIFSRGFAYLGLPPVFIGEIMLVLGFGVLARSGRLGPLFGQPTVWILTALLALTVARTVPYLGAYGLDAPRDAMQIGYAAFAFIVGGLLVARPERLALLLRLYRRYVVLVLSTIWAVYLVFKSVGDGLPRLPWASHVTIFDAKGGDILVHLAGITMFLVLGLGRRSLPVILLLALNIGLVMASNRGGMVAFALGGALAWMLRPPEARVSKLAYAFVGLVLVGVAVGPMMRINDGGRSISVEQIVLNVKSIFGQGDSHLDGTKKWRLEWWQTIWGYTVHGDYFWTGRGFGVNLAKEDGFDVIEELRSPHNGHMTILARMGVPGLALWVLLQVAWGLALLRQWAAARDAGRHKWMAVFAMLAGYVLAAHANASFDVYFEGPMGGIWFWTLFGVGLAAMWIHAHHPTALPDDDAPLDSDAPPAAPPVVAWSWHAPAAGAAGPPAARARRPQPLPAGRW